MSFDSNRCRSIDSIWGVRWDGADRVVKRGGGGAIRRLVGLLESTPVNTRTHTHLEARGKGEGGGWLYRDMLGGCS